MSVGLRIDCLMGTYGRYALVCESLACFLRQTALSQATLLIYNQHPTPLHFDHPRVRVVNETPPSRPLRYIRHRMHELADPAADLIHWWDDDDLYLPWHLEDCLRHIGDNAAWKPESCWMSEKNVKFRLYQHVFEGSWVFRADHLQAAPLTTHPTYTDHPVVMQTLEAQRLATTELAGRTSYIYRWATDTEHLSGYGSAGDAETQASRIETWRRGSSDVRKDGVLVPADLTLRWQQYLDGTKGEVTAAEWTANRKGVRARPPRAATPGWRLQVRPPVPTPQNAIGRWLVFGADPLAGGSGTLPARNLTPDEVEALIGEAQAHGVLAGVLRRARPHHSAAAYDAAWANALARLGSGRATTMMLSYHRERIAAAIGDLPVAVVKGATFARLLYPAPELRSYTDIDLLTRQDVVPSLDAALEPLGFRTANVGDEAGRQETKWLHEDNPRALVEVHTNLVHSPAVRAALSLTYDDIAAAPEGPAALLLVAVVHGSLDRFERLREVVDLWLAARAVAEAGEEGRFAALARRTGARGAAMVGLHLAYRLFGDERCRAVANGLGPELMPRLAGLLLTPSVVLSTMNRRRWWHSWRRQMYREWLKRGGLDRTRQARDK